MNIIETDIKSVVITIEPRLFRDERGYFFESFNQNVFIEKVCKTMFVQNDNESKSSYGVIRGLRFSETTFCTKQVGPGCERRCS